MHIYDILAEKFEEITFSDIREGDKIFWGSNYELHEDVLTAKKKVHYLTFEPDNTAKEEDQVWMMSYGNLVHGGNYDRFFLVSRRER